MTNWFANKSEIKQKTINAIMSELSSLLESGTTSNYWLDKSHNIFAFVNDNGDDDRWIEIHYELYDESEEIIGDLEVLNTEEVTHEDLLKEITAIVNLYFGD